MVIGHIVPGHFKFCMTQIMHFLFPDDLLRQNTGNSGISAAGENKVNIPAAGKGLFFQVFCQKPGHFAHIYRGTDDKGLLRMKNSMIIAPDPVQ